jgi:hypothetical protein
MSSLIIPGTIMDGACWFRPRGEMQMAWKLGWVVTNKETILHMQVGTEGVAMMSYHLKDIGKIVMLPEPNELNTRGL